MAATWKQVFDANPTTTFQANDVFYLARSPYGAGDDFGFTYSSLIPLTTKGDLLTRSGVTNQTARKGVGSDGTILQANSLDATGLAWSVATYPISSTINQILFSSATNTITGLATANNGALVTNSSGVPSIAGASPNADGRILATRLAGAPDWTDATYPLNATTGDIIYAITSDTFTVLNGNPSTTKMFLSQDGDSVIPNAPAWSSITPQDITGDFTSISVIGNVDDFQITSTDSDTNASTKISRFGMLHYDNSTEEPLTLVMGASILNENHVNIGGGTGFGNAATQVSTWIGGNSTTVLGTETVRVTAAGLNVLAGTITGSGANITALNGTNISSGTVAPTVGGTGLTTYTLGDLLYSSASNTLSKLAGNTSASKMFLSQTGNGTISAAPVWEVIDGADISGVITAVNGNTGAASPSSNQITITTGASNANGTAVFTGSGSTLTLSFNDANNNIGLGSAALNSLTSGVRNIAIGNNALTNVTTTGDSIAIGHNALINADVNTAIGIGSNALNALTTGVENVALGTNALTAITTQNSNTAVGYVALGGPSNTGAGNTGIGSQALLDNTSGSSNTAVGYVCLADNTTGGQNTSVGMLSMNLSSTGSRNVAMGYNALTANVSNHDNVAIGWQSLLAATATGNVAIGSGSASSAVTATGITAVGFNSLTACTGVQNTAVGYNAGVGITSGVQNTIVGADNAASVSTGGFNTILGYANGTSLTAAAARNIMIGTGNTSSGASDSNIYIGVNIAPGSESNTLRLGNGTGTAGTQINKTVVAGIRGITTGAADAVAVLIDSTGQLGTVSSSIRYKEEITDLVNSERIYNLRPVNFKLKDHKEQKTQCGLIAEEVEKVIPEIVVYNDKGEVETVQYQYLPILMLAETQKLKKALTDLQSKIAIINKKLNIL